MHKSLLHESTSRSRLFTASWLRSVSLRSLSRGSLSWRSVSRGSLMRTFAFLLPVIFLGGVVRAEKT
ncbi:MAG: hypothetical protein WAK13_20945, partial [Terriglobales bacterium]